MSIVRRDLGVRAALLTHIEAKNLNNGNSF